MNRKDEMATTIESKHPLDSSDSATTLHCTRVAAYCDEIARQMGFGEPMCRALRDAGLLHHNPEVLSLSADRKAAGQGLGNSLNSISWENPLTAGILAAYCHSVPAADARVAELVHVLEMADIFDEGLEFGPFDDERLVDHLRRGVESQDDPSCAFVLSRLGGNMPEDLSKLVEKLPVLPKIALEVLRIAHSHDVTVEALVKIARRDQVLAGNVLSAANSAFYNRGTTIRNLDRAVAHLGIDTTRNIALAVAVKPVLTVPGLRNLWEHSIEAAHIAEFLARRTEKINPSDAYTIGLLHDVGLLLLQLVNRQARECRERLKKAGCSTAVAELVTSGVSHAEAGAQVLRAWNLPEEYAAAIEYHHEPEHCESVFAALLYVVECVTGSEEDLPSTVRWNSAMMRLGLSPADLQDALSSFRHAIPIISNQ